MPKNTDDKRRQKLLAQAAHFAHHAQRHADAGRQEIATRLAEKAKAAKAEADAIKPARKAAGKPKKDKAAKQPVAPTGEEE